MAKKITPAGAKPGRAPRIGRPITYTATQKERQHMSVRIACNVSNELAGLITKVNEDGSINAKVFLDGPGDIHVENITQGKEMGQWEWPADYDQETITEETKPE